MDRPQPANARPSALVSIIGLFVLALAVALSFLMKKNPGLLQQTAAQSSPQCVPTPQLPTEGGNSTATPAPFEYGTPPLVNAPSVTPWPLAKITDLAMDLQDEDKVYVYVFRCNGTFELFLVRPGGPNADLSTAIPLQPGDIILDWMAPASLMGHYPPPGNSDSYAASHIDGGA